MRLPISTLVTLVTLVPLAVGSIAASTSNGAGTAGGVAVAGPVALGPRGPDAIYARAFDRILARAQTELEKKVTLLADHSTWDKALKVPSKHYVVHTTQSYAYAKALGKGLDQMALHIKRLLKNDVAWPKPRPVLLFPDLAAYNQFGDDKGGDHSSIYGSFFASGDAAKPVAALYHPNYTLVAMQITHSLVHQFVDHAYPGSQPPTWVSEGLAGYFALFWDWKFGAAKLADFQKKGTWVPLRRSFVTSLNRYGAKADQYFIELGMLFHYLLNYREDTKSPADKDGVAQGPFADYLRQTLRGQNVSKHPVQKLLFRRTNEIEAALLKQKF